MTTDQFVSQTIEKIRLAETDETVKAIINESRQSAGISGLNSLLTALDDISPLECTSEQWSRLRYAKMMLYKPGVPQPA